MTSSSFEFTTLPARPAVTRSVLAALTLTAAVAFAPSASAVAFDTAVTISGSVSYDALFSAQGGLPDEDGVVIGSAGVISGGGAVSTLISVTGDSLATPDMAFALTDIGDNVGLGANGHIADLATPGPGLIDGFFFMGLDAMFTVANTSTETFEIVLGVDYSSSADVDGPDAYAEAELTVDVGADGEDFVTYSASDTLFGDADSTGDLGTFGDPVAESGSETLLPPITITLAGVDSIVIDMALTLSAELYEDGAAFADAGGFVFVESVTCTTCTITPPPTNVPAPATLLLMGLGLLGLRRRWSA